MNAPLIAADTAEPLEHATATPTAGVNDCIQEPTVDQLIPQVLELQQTGLSLTQIASRLNVTRGKVTACIQKAVRIKKREISAIAPRTVVTREDIHKKIFDKAPEAVDTVIDVMENAEKAEVQLKAATDILDRAGFAPVQRMITYSVIEEMSREELISDIKRMLRLGAPIQSSPQVSPVNTIEGQSTPIDTNISPVQSQCGENNQSSIPTHDSPIISSSPLNSVGTVEEGGVAPQDKMEGSHTNTSGQKGHAIN